MAKSDDPKRAKVFWSGRSQAVRLPKEFRFETDEVVIRREGSSVILEPLEKPAWPRGYWESFGPVGPDFAAPSPLPDAPYRDVIVEEWERATDDEGD